MRVRVRCDTSTTNNNSTIITEIVYADCANIYNAIMDPPRNHNIDHNHPCILALQELAQGIHSLADGKLSSSVTDVHIRIVCASNYKAIDPPFHTDKCPLRGYVTLTGVGTEYMDRTCTPVEYVALRTLGVDGLGSVNNKVNNSLKMAKELEFIVMKGDHHDASPPPPPPLSEADDGLGIILSNNKKLLWSRSEACVHRSPPGNNKNKRVILSLDLADGGDDQEWEERGRKRNWRVGMTQRKSHLVS